jgi:hypothetical protein
MALLGLGLCVSGASQALALTINVSVNGTAVACPASSAPCDTWFDLSTATLPAGTKFTISNGPGGTAKIVADDVSAQDTLRLENTLFTATSAFSGNTINFWGTFNNPPTTAGGNIVNFWRNAQGAFIRGAGAPITASFTVNGKVKGTDSIVGPTTKTVVCGTPASCGQFALPTAPSQYWEPERPLNSAHEVRGVITNFKLPASGDKLQLTEFKVWSTAGAGEDLSSSGVSQCDCRPKLPPLPGAHKDLPAAKNP